MSGRYEVVSPQGSELLAVFRYTYPDERAEAERKAREARLIFKQKRERVGVRHHKEQRT
jgi:hypothetical protein